MNAQFKRGIVRENDAAKGMSRVEIADEDGVVSHWLAWNMPAASASKIYNAPDVGAQVSVLMDAGGEDGIILGARYSDVDTPPAANAKQMVVKLEGGLDITYDKATGTLSIKCPAKLRLEVAGTSIEMTPQALTIAGQSIPITGTQLTHNGKNVGSTHIHGGVASGPGTTAEPAN